MNKSELIDKIAEGAKLSKVSAGAVLDAFIGSVTEELKNGGTVPLVKFGTFKVNDRAARKGRNPQTGAEIDISASKIPVWKASKSLLD